jgi:hypothetical protein
MMQWNAGGWFGAQFGASIWILIAAAMSFPHDRKAAIVVMALFLFANLFGTGLWLRRDRINAYSAIQLLMPVLAISGLGAVVVLDRAGIYEAIQLGPPVSARSTIAILVLVFAALMILFHLIARNSNR